MLTRTRRRSVAFLVASAIAVGCGGAQPDDDGAGAPGAPKTETTPTLDAADVVRGFDPSDRAAIGELNQVATAGEVDPALTPLLDDADPITRWAALYVLANQVTTHDEGAVLVPLLDDDDPATRVIAAGSLSGLDYPETLPILVNGLRETTTLPYGDPPRPVAELAQEALEAYTGQTFADADAWQTWLDSASPLHWDGTGYVGA